MKILLKNVIKKNNGFTGIDLSVSLIVIVIAVSVIVNLFYNLYLSGTGIKRNVIATDYIINILETIGATDYELVTFDKKENEQLYLKNTLDELLKTEGNIENNIYKSNVNNFNITITIEKYSDRFGTQELKEDYIKIIKVSIEYKLGKNSDKSTNSEKLEISTIKTIK